MVSLWSNDAVMCMQVMGHVYTAEYLPNRFLMIAENTFRLHQDQSGVLQVDPSVLCHTMKRMGRQSATRTRRCARFGNVLPLDWTRQETRPVYVPPEKAFCPVEPNLQHQAVLAPRFKSHYMALTAITAFIPAE